MKIYSDEIPGLVTPIAVEVKVKIKKNTFFNSFFIYQLYTKETIVLDERFTDGLKMTSNILAFSKKDLANYSFFGNNKPTENIILINLYLPKNGDFNNTKTRNLIYLGKGFLKLQ